MSSLFYPSVPHSDPNDFKTVEGLCLDHECRCCLLLRLLAALASLLACNRIQIQLIHSINFANTLARPWMYVCACLFPDAYVQQAQASVLQLITRLCRLELLFVRAKNPSTPHTFVCNCKSRILFIITFRFFERTKKWCMYQTFGVTWRCFRLHGYQRRRVSVVNSVVFRSKNPEILKTFPSWTIKLWFELN